MQCVPAGKSLDSYPPPPLPNMLLAGGAGDMVAASGAATSHGDGASSGGAWAACFGEGGANLSMQTRTVSRQIQNGLAGETIVDVRGCDKVERVSWLWRHESCRNHGRRGGGELCHHHQRLHQGKRWSTYESGRRWSTYESGSCVVQKTVQVFAEFLVERRTGQRTLLLFRATQHARVRRKVGYYRGPIVYT